MNKKFIENIVHSLVTGLIVVIATIFTGNIDWYNYILALILASIFIAYIVIESKTFSSLIPDIVVGLVLGSIAFLTLKENQFSWIAVLVFVIMAVILTIYGWKAEGKDNKKQE